MDAILRRWLHPLGKDIPQVFAVGGAVRDFFLGRHPQDIDLVCREAPQFACRLAAVQPVETAVVPFEKKPGAACFRLVRKDDPRQFIDVVQMNGNTIEMDLARRDFTINAMAAPVLPGGEIGDCLDPFSGGADLKNRLLRECALQAFWDDPLRILRGVRFSAELDFSLETKTRRHMAAASAGLAKIAGERITAELFRLLYCPAAGGFLKVLDDLGALTVVFPEIIAMKGCWQNDYHHRDVWGHTQEVIFYCELIVQDLERYFAPVHDEIAARLAEADVLPLVKLAALLHDMGKPGIRKFSAEKNRVVFHGHAGRGAEMAEAVARRLKLSGTNRRLLADLIRHHMRPVEIYLPEVKEKTVIRWFRQVGDDALLMLLLALADVHGKSGQKLKPSVKQRFYDWTRQAATTYVTRWKKIFWQPDLITGTDLIALGLVPGPKLGEILRQVREKQDEGEIMEREQALLLAKRLLSL